MFFADSVPSWMPPLFQRINDWAVNYLCMCANMEPENHSAVDRNDSLQGLFVNYIQQLSDVKDNVVNQSVGCYGEIGVGIPPPFNDQQRVESHSQLRHSRCDEQIIVGPGSVNSTVSDASRNLCNPSSILQSTTSPSVCLPVVNENSVHFARSTPSYLTAKANDGVSGYISMRPH